MMAEERAPTTPRLSGGLIVFMVIMVLPAFVASAIVLGAWAVSAEVYAAEAGASSAEVAPWKSTLVGICPIH